MEAFGSESGSQLVVESAEGQCVELTISRFHVGKRDTHASKRLGKEQARQLIDQLEYELEA